MPLPAPASGLSREQQERRAWSRRPPGRSRLTDSGERLDPDRESNRGNRRKRAELRQQTIIAAAGNQRFDAVTLGMQFEFEAGVVIKPASESRRKAHLRNVDAARCH